MIKDLFIGAGVFTIILLIILIIFLPIICTIILGTYFATILGLTGLVWWAFVIVFYLILMGIISILA